MRAFLILVAGSLASGSAVADVYRVGDTNRDACDYETLQSAIDAATANGSGLETILIANTGSYTNVAAVVGDKSLLIEGGFDSCFSALPDVPADLSGNGGDPVISIEPPSLNTQVTLRGLRIHGGGFLGKFGSSGGGVYVTNNTFVTIEETTIENNNAAFGGGLYLLRNLGPATVQLNAGVQIKDNHAAIGGGGVYVNGGEMKIVADRVNIDGNISDDYGGGIALDNGIATVGNPAQVDARHDVTGASVSGNSAASNGGGIYVSTPLSPFADGALLANELIVDSNTAGQAGGGIAAYGPSFVSMARDYAVPLLEYQCSNSAGCSRISNNSVGAGAVGTRGGAIALSSGAEANIAQTIIRGNKAQDGSAVYMDDGTSITLEGVLVTGNQSYDTTAAGPTMHATFSSSAPGLNIAFTTFAGNLEMSSIGPNVPAEDIVALGGTQLTVNSTAFFDSAYPIVAYSAYLDDCVVAINGSSEDPYGTHTRKTRTSTPGFNDAVAGDYRLRSGSVLNDYCDSSAYQPQYRDLVLTTRCHDDPLKTNVYGACDVGAYESDQIFGNGFD